jgi:hypothetical protein
LCKMKIATAFLLLVACVGAVSAIDQCSQYTSCTTCLPNNFCGWCSPTAVVYNNGTLGSRCADQRDAPWTCDNLYQTTTCVRGYTCDHTAGQCVLAAPGEGNTKAHCEATCTKQTQFKCNFTTLQCESCVAGEPGCSKQDKASCDGYCKTPETLYKCDATSRTCSACAHPYCTSDSQCPGSYCDIKGQGPWTCHDNTCDQQYKCQAACACDTPAELLGINRGVQVDKDWQGGEFTWNFQPQLVVTLTWGSRFAKGKMSCPVNNAFSIAWDAGFLSGETWTGLYSSWQQGPETAEFAFAFATNSSITAPISITEAMAGNGYKVFSTSRCLKGKNCAFSASKKALVSPNHVAVRGLYFANDPCNAFATCSACLAAPTGLCGWCDTPVVYDDGSKGYNCAGFTAEGKSNPPWTCHLKYRRESCFDYYCDWANPAAPTCKQLPAGQSGLPKDECKLGCKQAQGLYRCNNQTFTCEHCDVKYCNTDLDCPGSYCQIDHSKPGPYICHGGLPDGCDTQQKCSGGCLPPDWGYTWRGVAVNSGYSAGEYDFTFYSAQNQVAFRTPSGGKVVADIHLGQQATVSEGTAITLKVVSASAGTGFAAGDHFYGLYEIVVSDKDKNLKFMFMAFGQSQPGNFDAAQKDFSFMLQTCYDAAGCDFTPAKVTV